MAKRDTAIPATTRTTEYKAFLERSGASSDDEDKKPAGQPSADALAEREQRAVDAYVEDCRTGENQRQRQQRLLRDWVGAEATAATPERGCARFE
jgi:hypothetical protein